MENIIYEKDYTENQMPTVSESPHIMVFEQAVSGPFLKSYKAAMDAIPKVIVPEYKKNYEYLLRICDDLAKRWSGSIRGVVDYQKWAAEIDLFLPFAEFDCPEDLKLLGDIAEKSHTVNFEAAEGGGIHIHIFNLYFEELMNEEHRSYIKYNAIMQDPKLAEMLGLSMELPPELELLAKHLNPLLDYAEKVSSMDRTEIFVRLLPRLERIMVEPDSFDTEVAQFIQELKGGDGAQDETEN